jgi:hypothetical protein
LVFQRIFLSGIFLNTFFIVLSYAFTVMVFETVFVLIKTQVRVRLKEH